MMKSLVAALAVLISATATLAQNYPSRPITLIVPFPAGGSTDVLARIFAERMRVSLGQPVIIENIPGAGGSLGVTKLSRSAPDGHTFSIAQLNAFVFSATVFDVPYDIREFEPIALLTIAPQWIIARQGVPANNVKELVDWLKLNPGKASFGTIGPGSPPHLMGFRFQSQTGTQLNFVPYRGGVQVIQDLTSGQIDLSMLESSGTLPMVRAGKIKALAMLSRSRWATAPDVPTAEEVGVSGLDMPFWHGFWAPKGAPKDIIAKLNAAVRDAFADPTVKQKLAELGQDIPPVAQQTPEALGVYHKAELDRWVPVIKAANIKGQ